MYLPATQEMGFMCGVRTRSRVALSDSPRVTQLEDQFFMRFYLEEAAETNLWIALFLPHFAKPMHSGFQGRLPI